MISFSNSLQLHKKECIGYLMIEYSIHSFLFPIKPPIYSSENIKIFKGKRRTVLRESTLFCCFSMRSGFLPKHLGRNSRMTFKELTE